MNNDSDMRWEVNHDGEIVKAIPKLTNNLDGLINDLFSQNGWKVDVIEKSGCYNRIKIYNKSLAKEKIINLYAARVRKEEDNRSPYEKRIQLGSYDPREKVNNKDELTIILGVYVFNEDDQLHDSIIVTWPVEMEKNYPANPSLRVNVENEILKAKIEGIYFDNVTGKNIIAFRPEFIFYYLEECINKQKNILSIEDNEDVDKPIGGYNIIYYGTPGCGKSYKVDEEFSNKKYMTYRTTFHPEYSNSDFVGQIIPKTQDNQIKYEFQAGPFSIALLNALKNPNKKICLIIEEINRGNASAIFGDIFQLLDRKKEGTSVYSIVNEPIKKYLLDNGVEIEEISIPSNMWIVATMNTSDQNVFTLDTAFKRRWRMHRIINEFDLNKEYDKKIASMYIPGSSYTWEQFITTINKEIMRKNPAGLNSEDKQLGVYFVTENELSVTPINDNKDDIDRFIEKVLLYIWDDVAKIDPSIWFGENIRSFDDLVKSYYENKLKIFKDLFKDQNDNESQINQTYEENQ